MLKLRSVDAIRRHHIFAKELQAIPAVEWIKSEENYDKALSETAKKLETIDNDIETIIRRPDEDMKLALGRAFYQEKETSVRDFKFPRYLPQGKVQLQRDLIRKLMSVAKNKKSIARDLNQEMGECVFQGEWEANTRIGIVAIDGKETELKLRKSLGLFSGYLNVCEHEFYKQMLNANLEHILHYYRMLLQDAEFSGKKVEPKLMSGEDRFYYYPENILDRIYYSRARDYLVECRDMWEFLNGSNFTKKYLITMEDVHPRLKGSTTS